MSNAGKWGDADDAVPGFIPWILAQADPDAGWWERQRSNPKRMGELSQAAFLLKAQSLGFGLALPWGDSEKYDFIVWARPQGRLLRVQVKGTGRLNCGGYDVQPVYSTRGAGKKTYTAAEAIRNVYSERLNSSYCFGGRLSFLPCPASRVNRLHI